MNKQNTTIDQTLEAYKQEYGDELGRLKWNERQAKMKIEAYHKKKIKEELQRKQRRMERVYTSVSKILCITSEVDPLSDEELDKRLLEMMFKVFSEAQTKRQMDYSNDTVGSKPFSAQI